MNLEVNSTYSPHSAGLVVIFKLGSNGITVEEMHAQQANHAYALP